ncbi:MAG: FtsX-like permease family protein [Candidatus Ratteibacteria bacterium]|jgi:putative ABC transport system permease protein
MNLLYIAFKNLWHRKVRTFLTIFGVGVSIAAFVSLRGLAVSMVEAFRTTYQERGTDLVVLEKGSFDLLSSRLDESFVDKIKAVPEVLSVNPVLLDITITNFMNYILIYGWEAHSNLFSNLKITGKAPVNEHDAIIGAMLAKKLNKKIGDSVDVRGTAFTLTGIFQSQSLFEEGSVIVLLPVLQRIKKMEHQVTLLNISLRKGLKPNKWFVFKEEKPDKQVQLRISQLVPEGEVKDLEGIVSSENILAIFSKFSWAVSIVAFIIAILGIANNMITSVLEQTREIGVLLAIGWRKTRIVSLILYESTLLGLMGGAMGLFLGYVTIRIFASMLQMQSISNISLDFLFVVKAIAASLVLGLLSGIYPALRAVSIQPIEVLRYE